MKTIAGTKSVALALLALSALVIPVAMSGQTLIGVLPVNLKAVSSLVLDAKQWQSFSVKIQDHYVAGMSGNINAVKLSREHILLLLKEMPSPDPDNLSEEACRTICKKEKLHYLFRFTVETLQISGVNVNTEIKGTIIDGINGKVFWEKPVKSARSVSVSAINEEILLDEIYKPLADNILKEIKALNY